MQSSAYKGPNQNYLNYVRSLAKPTKHLHNCLRAFIVGGLICCVGQFLRIEFQALFALEGEELAGAKKVLSAAAMTYVAALIASVAQLLRLIGLFGRRRDD